MKALATLWRAAVAAAGIVCGAAVPAAESNAPPPASVFFRHAAISDARLSPSGRYLAIGTAGQSKRVMLAIIDLQAIGTPAVAASFSDADVDSFYWVTDDRLVFSIVDLAAGAGEQGFASGLFSVRRDGSEQRQLIETRHVSIVGSSSAGRQQALTWDHRLIDIPGDGSDDVIVGEYHFDGLREVTSVSAKRLNVITGRSESLSTKGPEHAVGWWFDPKGSPRVVQTRFRGQEEVWWREGGNAAWRKIVAWTAEPAFLPRFVDAAGQLYVTTPEGKAQTTSLTRFDFGTGKPEAKASIATPGFDFDGHPIFDDATGKTIGMRVRTDADSTVWFEPAMKRIQQTVDARFPGRVNTLRCHRCESPDVVLVFSYSDQDPGSYWIYRPPENAWEPVGKVRPDIEPRQMASLDLHRIKARDGEDLPVWITAPRLAAGAPKPPAVVLVHGGPWVRGTQWQWNSEAQFLASRGYVVIEPEFRGSTGFGWRHFELGFKQWGGTMQDDVADAVQWAVGQGLADPKRMCIAGASYGGYATLMGLMRYPNLYRCGVAWVAVTDPRLLLEASWSSDISAEARRYSLPTLLGDPDKDAALLNDASPVLHAADIRAPLLIAFGSEDHRVPIEHGTRIRAALRKAGRDPEYVVYDGEAHGWLKTENQIDWWTRIERFLDRNLRAADPGKAKE